MIEDKKDCPQQSENAKPKRGRSVLIYLIILFAAAIILLLLAFFMQQRNNEALSGLQDSITSFQSLDALIESNLDLQEQVDELEAETAELQSQLNSANQQNEELNKSYQEYTDCLNALSALYTAEIKAAGEDYSGAADILSEWDPDTLRSAIEDCDAIISEKTDSEMSPLLQPRYEALLSALADKGYFDGKQFQLTPVAAETDG